MIHILGDIFPISSLEENAITLSAQPELVIVIIGLVIDKVLDTVLVLIVYFVKNAITL